jgi:hypothetical protein
VLSHGNSVGGEGKATNDMKNGHLSQGLKRKRECGGEHSDQTTTLKLVDAINSLGMTGMRTEAVIVDSDLPEGSEMVTVEGTSQYHMKKREGDLQFRGWDFHPIGRGTVHTCELPTGVDLSELIAMPVLAQPEESKSKTLLVKKSRSLMKKELKQKQLVKQELRESTAASTRQRWLQSERTAGRVALVDDSVARQQQVTRVCPKECCGKTFTVQKRNDYDRHVEKCGGGKAPGRRPSEMIAEHVGRATKVAEGEMIEAALPQRSVRFESELELYTDLGVKDCEFGSGVVVTCVKHNTKNTSLKVHITSGCGVLSMNQTLVRSVAEFTSRMSETTYPVDVTCELARPPMVDRGFARRINRNTAQQLTEEQEAFVTATWEKDHKTTAAVMCEEMEREPQFQNREELWLDELQINTMLKKIYRAENAKKKTGMLLCMRVSRVC